MSTENPTNDSIKILSSKHHPSSDIFDYFMCAMAGGLFAYIGQAFFPDKTPFLPALLTFAAMIFLIIAFYCGLMRIQNQNLITTTNQSILDCEFKISKREKALTAMIEAEKSGQAAAMTDDLGNPYTPQMFTVEIAEWKNKLESYQKVMKHSLLLATRFGMSRDFILSLGFLVLMMAKLIEWIPTVGK